MPGICDSFDSASSLPADAAATVPGTDPGRASFTVALNAARDQVILAAPVTAGHIIDIAILTAPLTPGGDP